ncbi:MAG: ABC transporter permease [Thermoanaerobaculales bacterium]|nr:ABC transporter permease [Thermoanaerobaculales bacterium]
MRRHLKLLDFALASLRRRPLKSWGLVVVYAFTVAVVASVLLLTRAIREEAAQILVAAPELTVQRVVGGRHEPIPLSYGDAIRGLPGVMGVEARFWGYTYDAVTDSTITVMGASEGLQGLEMIEGRLPTTATECAVGAGVAEMWGAGTGGEVILVDAESTGVPYEVVGVFRAPSEMLTNDLVTMTSVEAAVFLGLPDGTATDLAVRIANPNEVDTVAAKIKRAHPDSRPITRSEVLRTYDAVFHWRSGMMLAVFSGALVAFAILAWDKATGLSAEERREIGILKAIGWDTADVLELKVWEGLTISLTSLMLGLIAAMVHVFVLGAPLLVPVLRGWSVLFPELRPAPFVDPYMLFAIAFLTVVPYVAATVAPSWKAAITDPDEVVRG